MTKQNEMQRQF